MSCLASSRSQLLHTTSMRFLLSCCAMGFALAAPSAFAQTPQRATGAPLTLSVDVTDRSGNALGDVAVTVVSGPVQRSGSTGKTGSLVFRSMRAGTYRLRFVRDEFTTFEREVVLRAGQPASVSVALTPAPAAPPPPSPDSEPVAAAPERMPMKDVEPRSLSIPDFLDTHLIGAAPQAWSLLGCAEGGTARLLQVRDPLNDQEHADVDEVLYIVAGAGVVRIRSLDTKVRPGYFLLVPRGVPHSIRREGRNPLIAVSVLAGAPCLEGQAR